MKATVTATILVTVLVSFAAAIEGTQTLSVTATQVTNEGSIYYHLQFDLPSGIQSVRHARLHLRLDGSSKNVDGFYDPAPILEVYALNRALTGELTSDMFHATRLPMSRPVAVGTNRVVKIDITEIVQDIVADPASNYGLVVGSVTAGNAGLFTLRSEDAFPSLVVVIE